jgi:hypothetical protein
LGERISANLAEAAEVIMAKVEVGLSAQRNLPGFGGRKLLYPFLQSVKR